MIQRDDILSIPYLKKSVFTGSFQGMRYRLARTEKEETKEEMLRAVIWEAPYNFTVTAEEKKEYQEFPFSEDGILEAIQWMNQKWEASQDRWRQALNNW